MDEYTSQPVSDEGWADGEPLNRISNVRLSKYGITLEFLNRYMEFQGGRCAICHVSFTETKFFIDHDHRSGRVRGLLCPGCNTGLGFFRDNTTFLARAIRYLNRRH